MTQPKNALIKQFSTLLDMDGVKLEIDDEAVRFIARRALDLNTGARGLRSIVENAMMDTMYSVPDNKNIESVQLKVVGGSLKAINKKAQNKADAG